MLANLPSINTLVFAPGPVSYIQSLVVTSTTHLCPKLHTLHLECAEITSDGLISLAASRNSSNHSRPEGATRLSTVVVDSCFGIPTDTRSVVTRALEDLSINVDWAR
ncbi:hypothetical protein BOTBODRAFT_61507 [Botryobasidium botryosum FD-172 SS1]|uniref:F-box domain-containing protein n=1 Tax=Botryobasidium botryosum (strain FD-172 SS1) TaxID=930990 RepID=A0A067N1R0_BOTB1|nr:hypothetical protein BOTBODRAFT_61507 [Botryobasidium botryosum FD-172 SS1]